MRSRFKFKFACNVMAFVSLLACALVAVSATATSAKQQTIVVYGDSLSAAYGINQHEGWVSLLQQRLKSSTNMSVATSKVINASISGETTSGGLSRFAEMLNAQKPDIVILELGANDGLRGLSPIDTRKQLEAMIQQAVKNHAKVLLLGMKIPPNYGLKYSQQFSENYAFLAKKYQLPLVPFFLDGVAGNPALVQADGLHPTAAAQPQLLENVWPALNSMLKKP